jgi:membrane protease YdiL (CAAX protease family)
VLVSLAAAALSLVALTVFALGSWLWLLAAVRAALTWQWLPGSAAERIAAAVAALGVSPRLPLVAWRSRGPVPWAFFDLLALVGIWLVGSLAASIILHQSGWLPAGDVEKLSLTERQALIVGNVAIELAILAIGLPLIALRAGATLRDFGWPASDFWSDVKLGLIGFAMLAPPVYAIQGLLVYFWQPSKHPLTEMFKGTPDAGFFALLVFTAVVVAPLFEELMFRVVLQGFLEKAFDFRGELHELFFGTVNRLAIEPLLVAELSVPGGAAVAIDPNPYAPSEALIADAQLASDRQLDQPELRGWRAWLPIAISSSIFALLHYSHGPDWIPLLVLAAGMGYLYQRTHRLLPSLIVHMLLNGLSMWGLWVQVYEGLGS